ALHDDNSTAFRGLNWLLLGPMTRMEPGDYSSYAPLRNLLAVPAYVFSDVVRTADNFPYKLPETTGYFAKPVYRVTIQTYSIYTYSVLSIFMWAWCVGIMVWCWFQRN